MADSSTEVAIVPDAAKPVPTTSLLDAIVQDTNAALVQSSDTQMKVLGNLGIAQSMSEQLTTLNYQRAQDSATVVSAQQAGQLKAQQYTLKAANAAGVDPTQATDYLMQQIEKHQNGLRIVEDKYNEFVKKRDSKFFDSPTQFIMDAFTIETTKKELRDAAAKTNLIEQTIQSTNSVIGQAANISSQIKESVTAASADAATRLATNDAVQAATRSALDAVKYNTEALNTAMNMSKDRLNLMYNSQSAQMAVQNQNIVLQKFANEKFEFGARQEAIAADKAAKKEGKDTDQYIVDRINLGRAARGVSPLTGPGVKASIQLFKGGGSKELMTDYQNGERTSQTGIPMLGSSPAESLETIKEYPTEIVSGRERVVGILSQAEEAMRKDPLLAGSKDDKAKAAFINKFVAKSVAQQYAQVTPNSGNMFDVGSLTSYLELSSVKNIPVVAKLLAPASQSGAKMDDPKAVIDLAISAVKAGTITSAEFTGLSDVYQYANLINQQAANPLGLGIQVPNAGRNYFVKLNTFGSPLDITNPTEIGRYLSKQLAEQALAKGKAPGPYGRPGTPNAMRRLYQEQGSIRDTP